MSACVAANLSFLDLHGTSSVPIYGYGVAETLETEWIKADLKMINLRQHTHSPRDIGKLTGRKKNNFEQGTLLALFCVLYVDNGVFTFEDPDQLKRGLNLIYQHFARFGLEMHIGKGKKASKTECVFFPPP